MISLDSLLRKLLDAAEKSWLPLLHAREANLAAVVLLARRLKAASPDAKHPGKAGEESCGESALSPQDSSQAFLGQEPSIFRISQRQAEVVWRTHASIFAKCGSRAVTALVGRGAKPRRVLPVKSQFEKVTV